MTHLSPSDIDDAPELAILQVLEVTIDIARAALYSATPELQTDYFLETIEPAVHVCLADAIMLHLDGLRCALQRYRHYADDAHARSRCSLVRPKPSPQF